MSKKKEKPIQGIYPSGDQIVVVYEDDTEKSYPKPEWFNWYEVHRYNDGFIDGKDELRGKMKDLLGV